MEERFKEASHKEQVEEILLQIQETLWDCMIFQCLTKKTMEIVMEQRERVGEKLETPTTKVLLRTEVLHLGVTSTIKYEC